MRTVIRRTIQSLLRCRNRNERTGGVCGRGFFGFHGHRANAGVWERSATGHIERGVMNELSRQIRETGFCHMSLQLIDHDRCGTEQFVMDGTGRGGLIPFHVAVPAFELQSDGCGISIFQVKEGREEKHRSSDEDAFEC